MEKSKAKKLVWKITIIYLVLIPVFFQALVYAGMLTGSPGTKEWKMLPMLIFCSFPVLSIFVTIPLAWISYKRKNFVWLRRSWKIPLLFLGAALLLDLLLF